MAAVAGEAGMAKFGIGQSVRRVEDQRLITGRGPLYRRHQPRRPGVARRRPLAPRPCPDHGDRTDAAKAAPGVLAVVTGADLEA